MQFNKRDVLFLVPDAPQSVKALQMSPESILISWLSPEYPNGIITQYTVYVQEAERVSPFLFLSLSVSFVKKNLGLFI